MTNDAIPAELRTEIDDSERLLNLVKQLAADVTDPKVLAQVADIEAQFASAKKVVSQPPSAYSLPDMPEEALDGALGELCKKYLGRYPRAYAWIALVTVASALVPRRSQSQKFNIYGVLVGPVGSGKTETIRAAQTLLHISTPELLDAMVGSGEGLMQRIADAFGSPRLYSPDELSHLLTKMAIQNSSFPSILTRAFNYDQFEVVMAKGKRVQFHALLSILGGVVDEKFGISSAPRRRWACSIAVSSVRAPLDLSSAMRRLKILRSPSHRPASSSTLTSGLKKNCGPAITRQSRPVAPNSPSASPRFAPPSTAKSDCVRPTSAQPSP